MRKPLKLIALYNARTNVCTITDHNLTPEEAEKQVGIYRAQDLTAFAVAQRAKHHTSPYDCPACREDAARASDVLGNAQFERREEP